MSKTNTLNKYEWVILCLAHAYQRTQWPLPITETEEHRNQCLWVICIIAEVPIQWFSVKLVFVFFSMFTECFDGNSDRKLADRTWQRSMLSRFLQAGSTKAKCVFVFCCMRAVMIVTNKSKMNVCMRWHTVFFLCMSVCIFEVGPFTSRFYTLDKCSITVATAF